MNMAVSKNFLSSYRGSDDDFGLYGPNSVWNRAAITSQQGDPFCCLAEWQMTYHDVFEPNREIFARENAGNVLAFAVIRVGGTPRGLVPLEDMWRFGNPLLGPNAVDLFADTLPGLFAKWGNDASYIRISGILPRGRLLCELIARFGNIYRFAPYERDVQCGASLEGGIDGFLSRRSGNFRRKLKKALRKAVEVDLQIERHVPSSPSHAEEIYQRMLAVELASWKGKGHCGMADGRCRPYYLLMLRRLSVSASGRVMFAVHDGKDIGFIFGGKAGSVYRGQQFSYDDNWRDASIGNVLQFSQLEWLCEEGASRYDMGPLCGSGMEYKQHWTEKRFWIETWSMTKR
jgi:CelD/BcsL family acetyltransferase involved in cellulose biosynthesis